MKDICRLEMPMSSGRRWRGWGLALLLAWSSLGLARVAMADGELGLGCPPTPPDQKGKDNTICFNMVPSGAAATCLPNATARVRVKSMGPVEMMHVDVAGLPPNTEFDFFVIQVPKGPFGLSWYQGDIETHDDGKGHGMFPDAETNPQTAPVHTHHLGLWFNSPDDAAAAGCPNTVTPFNGDHTAGIQVLNTSNFPDDQGPLRQLVP